jgi:catechol 2,3-dioxygenase-like lactoylglutathione lyase family enzyme
VRSIDAAPRAVARHAAPRARDGHGHPDRSRAHRVPGVGESKVELVEPTDDSTGVARFLESKGEGFHHVCFEVPNLAETLLRLEISGLELIDTSPRRGAEGPVAFIPPALVPWRARRADRGARAGPAWRSLGFPPAS